MEPKKNCGCGKDPCITYGAELVTPKFKGHDKCLECGNIEVPLSEMDGGEIGLTDYYFSCADCDFSWYVSVKTDEHEDGERAYVSNEVGFIDEDGNIHQEPQEFNILGQPNLVYEKYQEWDSLMDAESFGAESLPHTLEDCKKRLGIAEEVLSMSDAVQTYNKYLLQEMGIDRYADDELDSESNGANDDISLMMNLIDEIEANDIWNETINEMIRRGKAVRRPDGKVIFSDRVPQFDIIEDIAQYTTPEIKSAENSDHWMTFGRVDYNWVTDPEDLELTDENFYIIDAHIRDEVRYVIDNDNDNSSGESNLSSGDLNLTQEDEDEFTIYYYWGSPFTTGVNSAESEDDGPTNCGVCEVKIGYDEAIHYEELEWCEKCYEEQMERDMQNYTHDETDCISCGFAISPNDVRVELVEGLCPDCNYIRNAESEDENCLYQEDAPEVDENFPFCRKPTCEFCKDAPWEYKWNNGEKVQCCCSEPTRKDDFCPEGGYNNSGDECKFECGHEECEAEMKAKYGAESFEAQSGVKKAEDLSSFTSKELTESSAIHGDFDHASINYSGHQNLIARAESQSMGCNKCGDKYPVLDYKCNACSGCSGCCECASAPQMMGLDAEENIALSDPSFWMNYPITSMLATAGIFAIGKTLLNSRKGDI